MYGLGVGSDFKEYLNRVADFAKNHALKAKDDPVVMGVNTSVMRAAFWIRDHYPCVAGEVSTEIIEGMLGITYTTDHINEVVWAYHEALIELFKEQEEFLAGVRSDDLVMDLEEALTDQELDVLGYHELIRRALDEIKRLRDLNADSCS